LVFREDVVLYEPEEDGPPADLSATLKDVSLVELVPAILRQDA
jgi:hypothetical protein